MYADKMTKSILNTLEITKQRRQVQEAYNKEHGITPRSVRRGLIQDLAQTFGEVAETLQEEDHAPSHLSADEVEEKIKEYEIEMRRAAKELRFEDAAHFRDLLQQYQKIRMLEDDL